MYEVYQWNSSCMAWLPVENCGIRCVWLNERDAERSFDGTGIRILTIPANSKLLQSEPWDQMNKHGLVTQHHLT